jgi:hypothetical protein
MNTFCVVFIAAVLFVHGTGRGSAQMGMRGAPPQFHGLWHGVVGSGSVYEMQGAEGNKSTMEVDVIGKESVAGKDASWMEITMNNSRMGGEMVMKYLLAVDASQMQISKVIMQMPGRPPMEMSQMMTGGQRKPIEYSDVRNNMDDVGSESVTTPAGTFSCEHYRAKDGTGDAWVSDKVVPFGLVKYQGKSQTMTLTKTVSDAKDKITGTPQPFDPMKMMQQQPQPPQP